VEDYKEAWEFFSRSYFRWHDFKFFTTDDYTRKNNCDILGFSNIINFEMVHKSNKEMDNSEIFEKVK